MGAAHSIALANPARGIAPLLGVGSLVDYTFPLEPEAGMDAPWSCDVENMGTDGVIAFGIVNDSGSPGNIVIGWGGEETILPPGRYWRVFTTAPVPKGYHLIESGTVRFETEGTYAVRLWAMHEEAGTWYYDDETLLNPTVAQSWPITDQEQVFSNTRISPGLGKDACKTKNKNIDTAKILGGRIDYTIKFEEALLAGCTARIFWNNEMVKIVLFQAIDVGKSKTGTIDLTVGQMASTNELKICLSHVPATFNVCLFNVWVVLGYSAVPDIDEPWKLPFELEWWQWALIAGTGIAVVYIVAAKPQMPSVIYVAPPGRQS